jgi:hypothetical protein
LIVHMIPLSAVSQGSPHRPGTGISGPNPISSDRVGRFHAAL